MHRWDTGSVGVSPANRDNNADGDFDDAGDEILISDDFNSAAITLSYDDNGNLTDDGIFEYDYDAWNRLRLAKLVVGSDSTTIRDNDWYGGDRLAQTVITNQGPELIGFDGGDATVRWYYDGGRVLETRNGSNQTTTQFITGGIVDVNGDPTESNDTNPDDQTGESTAYERYVIHRDRRGTVVAITEYDTGGTNNGNVLERRSTRGRLTTFVGGSGETLLQSPIPAPTASSYAHSGVLPLPPFNGGGSDSCPTCANNVEPEPPSPSCDMSMGERLDLAGILFDLIGIDPCYDLQIKVKAKSKVTSKSAGCDLWNIAFEIGLNNKINGCFPITFQRDCEPPKTCVVLQRFSGAPSTNTVPLCLTLGPRGQVGGTGCRICFKIKLTVRISGFIGSCAFPP